MAKRKNPAAVALAKRRLKMMTAEERAYMSDMRGEIKELREDMREVRTELKEIRADLKIQGERLTVACILLN